MALTGIGVGVAVASGVGTGVSDGGGGGVSVGAEVGSAVGSEVGVVCGAALQAVRKKASNKIGNIFVCNIAAFILCLECGHSTAYYKNRPQVRPVSKLNRCPFRQPPRNAKNVPSPGV